jgi:hypothetical protein
VCRDFLLYLRVTPNCRPIFRGPEGLQRPFRPSTFDSAAELTDPDRADPGPSTACGGGAGLDRRPADTRYGLVPTGKTAEMPSAHYVAMP